MKKKRVLFFIKNLTGGGAERVLIDLLKRLDPDEFDISVRTIFDQGVYISQLPEYITYRSSIKKEFKGFVYLAQLFSPRRLYRFFIKEDYDLVVAFLEGITTRIASGGDGVKKITWLHIDQKRSIYLKPYRSLKEMEACYNRFDHVCAVSDFALDGLKALIDLKTASGVIHNIIEKDHIRRLAQEEAGISFPTDAIILGSVGRLEEQKGYLRLVPILGRLKREGYSFYFYLLGTGTQEQQIRTAVKQHALEDRFFMLGFQKNPYKYMKHFDLFVSSSHYEGFSLVVCEAAIVDVPSLTTYINGLDEIVGPENKCSLAVDNSEEGLYNGLKELIEKRDMLESMKKNCKLAGDYFQPEKIAAKVVELFNQY